MILAILLNLTFIHQRNILNHALIIDYFLRNKVN